MQDILKPRLDKITGESVFGVMPYDEILKID